MQVFVTGATGFIGSALVDALLARGHQVVALTRSPSVGPVAREGLRFVTGDPLQGGAWQEEVGQAQAVINLAGESIFGRWNEDRKRRMHDSRVELTRRIVEALPSKDALLLNGSAVGYYGTHADDRELDEDSPAGEDFLARLCVDWEREALAAEAKGVRVIRLRIGIVLGRDGGALAQMIRQFKAFAGGRTGKGRQWFSWIHLDDLVAALVFLLEHDNASGAYNLTAPTPVTNGDFAKLLGRALHRPSFLPTPGFALKLFLGEFSEVLLKGQRVAPKRLLGEGFVHRYPDAAGALAHLLLPAKP